MSIESTRAPEGAKAATQAQRGSAAGARPDKSAASPGQGFANLMSLLSASEVPAEPVDQALATTETAPLATPDALVNPLPTLAAAVATTASTVQLGADAALPDTASAPLAATTPAPLSLAQPPLAVVPAGALPLPAPTQPPGLAVPQASPGQPGDAPGVAQSAAPVAGPLDNAAETAAVAQAPVDQPLPGQDSLLSALPLPAAAAPVPVPPEAVPTLAASAGLVSAAGSAGKSASDSLAGARSRSGDKLELPASASAVADAARSGATVAPEVAAMLDHRRVAQAQAQDQTQALGLGRVQTELREARLQATALPLATAVDASRAATSLPSLDALVRPSERQAGRAQAGQVGGGFEGLLGSALTDKLGISPTYEVAGASAVVPETQLAETVSYWASHGVQSAELTLDGLGTEPVEVRISVEGDQAQIDFRSNQPEVRQVLESASAQLKALLSGEGLQLSGMSVGTSGRGQTQGDGRQPRPGQRQATLTAMEPLAAASVRSANPAVGRGLDLYV